MKIPHRHLEKGQAMMVAVLFFVVVSMTMIFGITGPALRQQAVIRDTLYSRQSFFLAEAGIDDVIYQLSTGKPVLPVETLELAGNTVTITTTDVLGGKEITASGDVSDRVRKIKTNIAVGAGVAFYYGIQAGEGGLFMENTSSIIGNVFSNGIITGDGPANNLIDGGAVSGDSDGLINNVHISGSAFAHTITDSLIDEDAYYQNISGTTVLGVFHPNSPDQATSTLPISDEKIEEWKQVALDGGTISSPCPYKIEDDITIGPKKIACDVEISGTNFTVTLAGNLWVEGSINIMNSPTIRVDSALGNQSVAVIADNPSNQNSSSKISLQNSALFQGSGTPGSYILFISQNRSAESGGSEVAIDVKNTVSGALLVYAGHGEITLQNSISLREVTAYRIRTKNTAQITYETGLANLLFSTGPSGGYEILDWLEIE